MEAPIASACDGRAYGGPATFEVSRREDGRTEVIALDLGEGLLADGETYEAVKGELALLEAA